MGGAHFPGDDDVTRDAPLGGDVDPRDVGKLEHGLALCSHSLLPREIWLCFSCWGSNFGGSSRLVDSSSALVLGALAAADFARSCEHYRRRCKIVAPCCGQVFPCRHCHNEATVRLLFFFSCDQEKGQYHCYDCGICRIGGKENFFHCVKCGSCYAVALRDNHQCVENSMRQNCPICYEIEATIMPPVYRYKIWVLCNDCNKVSEVNFHVIGHKCSHCNSYNTRSTSRPADSSGSSSDSSDNNL
ncbi:hypothetical protein PR202_gb23555 [Eleusine coracana subsp. coracana]|uniref:CHY-type domain-containing protein n=1 Tax=Eleusine coracana subsp. coracana TaxID=191504 RepID=A0AAV5FK81_ELECO|nr:hypothetical protein PR202_gb23555 [Eleusine coracana subsp. coracana]